MGTPQTTGLLPRAGEGQLGDGEGRHAGFPAWQRGHVALKASSQFLRATVPWGTLQLNPSKEALPPVPRASWEGPSVFKDAPPGPSPRVKVSGQVQEGGEAPGSPAPRHQSLPSQLPRRWSRSGLPWLQTRPLPPQEMLPQAPGHPVLSNGVHHTRDWGPHWAQPLHLRWGRPRSPTSICAGAARRGRPWALPLGTDAHPEG